VLAQANRAMPKLQFVPSPESSFGGRFLTFAGSWGCFAPVLGISRVLEHIATKFQFPVFGVKLFNGATSGMARRRHPPEIQDGGPKMKCSPTYFTQFFGCIRLMKDNF